jgi:hypothetical protein
MLDFSAATVSTKTSPIFLQWIHYKESLKRASGRLKTDLENFQQIADP